MKKQGVFLYTAIAIAALDSLGSDGQLISVAQLKAGIYIVKLSGAQASFTSRLVKR